MQHRLFGLGLHLRKVRDADMALLCRYELNVQHMRMLDWYGGAHDIAPQDYFAAEGDLGSSSQCARCRGTACLPAALSSLVPKWLLRGMLRAL